MKLAVLVLFPLLSWGAIPWDMGALSHVPRVYDAATSEPGVKALYFESVPYQGKPTRVFAYYGAPSGKKLPAMVLVHGGGGTAFAEWVRMWNRRGYAAIAMDTCGNLPDKAEAPAKWTPVKKRHEFGGPAGWGDFAHVDAPLTDQWSYHAVAAVVLAHSLVRSFAEVDPKRIGLTGISWGGYLTSIVAGVDQRFRFAAPVYGCGFLGEDSAWLKDFEQLGPERAARWLSFWDPSVYLPSARMPMLWVTGTNDFAYPFSSLQKSYRLPRGKRTLAIRVRMNHNHPDGASPEEIHAFAEALTHRTQPMPVIVKQTPNSAQYKSKRAVIKAELNYTKDRGRWQDRMWEIVPAQLDAKARKASASIPEGATVWYLNLFDDRGLVVSTEHGTVELSGQKFVTLGRQ